jgi:uncharacterized protein with PQ loop repeat
MVRNIVGLKHHIKECSNKKVKTKLESVIDKLIYFVAIVGPLSTVPQVLKIWNLKNAAGISALTWFFYIFINFFWLTYGIIHKEKPIIITALLCIILDFFVFLGALIYG